MWPFTNTEYAKVRKVYSQNTVGTDVLVAKAERSYICNVTFPFNLRQLALFLRNDYMPTPVDTN